MEREVAAAAKDCATAGVTAMDTFKFHELSVVPS
jgi:hypothetical protein